MIKIRAAPTIWRNASWRLFPSYNPEYEVEGYFLRNEGGDEARSDGRSEYNEIAKLVHKFASLHWRVVATPLPAVQRDYRLFSIASLCRAGSGKLLRSACVVTEISAQVVLAARNRIEHRWAQTSETCRTRMKA